MKTFTLAGLAIAALVAVPASAQQPRPGAGADAPMTRAGLQQRIQEQFNTHDTNHDGFLAGDELGPDAQPMLARLDANHDGKISLEEATAATMSRFDAADTDHDGTLSPAEREAAMARMQQQPAAPAQQPAQPQGN